MKRKLCLLAALLLLLSACSAPAPEGNWNVYFPSSAYLDTPALQAELRTLSPAPSPDELLNVLLNGPTSSDLFNPFPESLFLRSWSLKNGVLILNLSEQYSALSGIHLTLADYSIVMTMCQLPDVDTVTISVPDSSLFARHRQTLSPNDILLDNLLLP